MTFARAALAAVLLLAATPALALPGEFPWQTGGIHIPPPL